MSAPLKLAGHSLYEADFHAWTREQAAVLRALAPERVPPGLDAADLAEEIESLGRSELHVVESLILNILVHLLELAVEPEAPAARHWRAEILTFQLGAMKKFSPSMRRLVAPDRRWREARRLAAARLDEGRLPASLPAACPVALSDLLAEDFDLDRVLAQVAACLPAPARRA